MSVTRRFMKSQENVSYKEIYEISRNCQLQGDL